MCTQQKMALWCSQHHQQPLPCQGSHSFSGMCSSGTVHPLLWVQHRPTQLRLFLENLRCQTLIKCIPACYLKLTVGRDRSGRLHVETVRLFPCIICLSYEMTKAAQLLLLTQHSNALAFQADDPGEAQALLTFTGTLRSAHSKADGCLTCSACLGIRLRSGSLPAP